MGTTTSSSAEPQTKPQPPINLLRGWPNTSLLPAADLKTASKTSLTDPTISNPALEYGPDEGYQPLRHEVAQWLTSFYTPATPITEDRICISGGASQDLACILQVFTDPVYTRNIWLVAPVYHLVSRIFDDSGFAEKLRAAPEDEEGVDIGYLDGEMGRSEEQAIREGNSDSKLKPPRPWRKVYKHVIYATPTFSNPSTKIMTTRRREQLVRLARKYDALIISDDVYDHLQWPISPSVGEYPKKAYVPRIVDVDRFLDGGPSDDFGNAVSNGSFSKIVGPGCRTGWAEGTPKFAYGLSQTYVTNLPPIRLKRQLTYPPTTPSGSSRSGGCPSQLVASFITQLLSTSTLQTHINTTLQPSYASRYHRTISAVRTHLLPLGVSLPSKQSSPPELDIDMAGGYFVWLKLPEPLRAKEVAKRCLDEEEVIVAQGGIFEVKVDKGVEGGRNCFERFVRVCFAWESEDRLDEGIERMGRVVGRMIEEGGDKV
ncbi:hypothetical protein FQN54_001145 [Arachnomyces sp. PD_36]|nr:hypothetical protein FQN54_001145 [Arachnomyces sp. PD_36]